MDELEGDRAKWLERNCLAIKRDRSRKNIFAIRRESTNNFFAIRRERVQITFCAIKI